MGDLLTAYGGQTISYDGIGNPLNDGTWSYTWKHGRQLASMSKLDQSETWQFTYNADGLRTQRTNGTRTYQYTYNGDKLTHMTVDGHTMYFTYDASGTPLNLVYDGYKFYYITNLQGDVISIVNGNGTEFVRYTYDAWGKVEATGSATNLRFYNPLRYRGYVYDPETELYYLQSRYYNPEMGRFINADGFAGTGQGMLGNNMFAYCLNNPVNFTDPTGEIAIEAIILIGSIVVGVACAAYTAYVEYKAGCDTEQIVGDSICAGISGFSLTYSLGMSAYQVYQNFCYLNALTPVTEIGGHTDVGNQLQKCANTANSSVSGKGPVVGTKKHTVFATEVNKLNNVNLRTEVSYLNGIEVKSGTKGSVRFDVLQFKGNTPIAAWDLKTGTAMLTASRISEMQEKSGLSIPIYMIR